MSVFDKLFGKKKAGTNKENPGNESQKVLGTAGVAASAMKVAEMNFNKLAAEKDGCSAVTEKELIKCFSEYFAPNKEFFSTPGGEKYKAYFAAINLARDEMINNPELFKMATKWDISRLTEMLNNPEPAITNMLVCGLIFHTGSYGVVKSFVYCVDFCERIPNCIALYLLLTARKLPPEKRTQIIDAGDGSDLTAFKTAMESLQVLDSHWRFTIA